MPTKEIRLIETISLELLILLLILINPKPEIPLTVIESSSDNELQNDLRFISNQHAIEKLKSL